jgi:hydroxypyruvate reductase
MTDHRRLVTKVFMAGVAAADPYSAVMSHAGDLTQPAQIIAVGKAAVSMARAALEVFPHTPCRVVTNYENAVDLVGATVMAAGHPVPDAQGFAAAKAVLSDLAVATGPVLALISGGGSALLPAPVDGVSLADKAQLNAALLGAGIDIVQMNLVRQQISKIKGGGVLRAAAPHCVTALILSDVVGDDLSAIASGPTVAPLGTKADACAILKAAQIWDDVPVTIRNHLSGPDVALRLPDARNILVGSNPQSVAAMLTVAPQGICLPMAIEGDVADAARLICDQSRAGITLWGGETTVQLRGNGRGGRNQELALRIALEAQRRGWSDWTCLQGGTDGRDGPTDAAGGLVDTGTLARIRHAGGDLDALLANNDSYRALKMAGDLLITGATGTNVADLGILIRND